MNFISIGEVLWDVVGETEHLGGAPLNVAAHAAKLGHKSYMVSAVGEDERGRKALSLIRGLGVSTDYISTQPRQATGHVSVTLHNGGQPCFTIHRPAAYDFIELTAGQRQDLAALNANWIYYGTLAQLSSRVRDTTAGIIQASPRAKRFYDINLRVSSYNRDVVEHLLSMATVTKLNDAEIATVERLLREPPSRSIEEFCRKWSARFGWEAACVTRGEKGCSLLLGDEYVESPVHTVDVVDAIGAGDGFAAGLMHGLSNGWDANRLAGFANRLGALIASRAGAIPSWSLQELDRSA